MSKKKRKFETEKTVTEMKNVLKNRFEQAREKYN